MQFIDIGLIPTWVICIVEFKIFRFIGSEAILDSTGISEWFRSTDLWVMDASTEHIIWIVCPLG
jgi:hypothetical protein